jgi:tricorn protease-like protein
MTGFDAIKKVKTELDSAELSLTGGIYQFSKPIDVEEDEFIEINALTVPEAILQIANVNVNIYVKDIVVGTPDNGRLETLLNEVKAVFPVSRSDENIHIFPGDTAIIVDVDNNRHYVNLRLQVNMLN